MELNPAQLQAVHTLSGPLLVLAGAGTGKTRVVMHRLVELIRGGTPPSRILAVTFTNKAATEMQQRAAELLGRRLKEKPEISTFHSLCVRILRRRIRHLGYPETFAIYDRGDQESVARGALREIKVADALLKPSDLIYLISRWKTASIGPEQAGSLASNDKEHLGAAAYRRYQNALKLAGAVDFDDLLLLTEELFRRFPKIRREEADRFDHLMVDEYQDTNGNQYRIVKALAAGHRNLCVVGDDDQSIYGWRGAEVAHILRFRNDWPEAKVVRLEVNYRSTHEIVAWANRLIAFNKNRHGKALRATLSGEPPKILQFPDESTEARAIVDDIRQRIANKKHRRASDFAILFRTNEQPRIFEETLRRAGVPYVLIGGMSFFDRKEIRDILAYLKLAVNPRDEVSLLRVINTPARGIGQSTVKRLMETAIPQGKPLWDVLPELTRQGKFSPAVGRAINGFRSLVTRYHEQTSPGDLVSTARKLIEDVAYAEEIVRQYPNPDDQQARWAAIEELVNAVGNYQKQASEPTLAGFVQEITLGGREEEQDKESQLNRDAVALMTLHSAKGLEFPEVYMVGMEEGLLPHKRSVSDAGDSIDEERRLCYVGLTRAERRLRLSLALNRMRWGKLRPTQPSRFLYEITGQADNPNYLATKQGRKTSVRTAVSSERNPPKRPHKKAAKTPTSSRPATKKRTTKKSRVRKKPSG